MVTDVWIVVVQTPDGEDVVPWVEVRQGYWLPLVSFHEEGLVMLRERAMTEPKLAGLEIRILRFSQGQEVEVLDRRTPPPGDGH